MTSIKGLARVILLLTVLSQALATQTLLQYLLDYPEPLLLDHEKSVRIAREWEMAKKTGKQGATKTHKDKFFDYDDYDDDENTQQKDVDDSYVDATSYQQINHQNQKSNDNEKRPVQPAGVFTKPIIEQEPDLDCPDDVPSYRVGGKCVPLTDQSIQLETPNPEKKPNGLFIKPIIDQEEDYDCPDDVPSYKVGGKCVPLTDQNFQLEVPKPEIEPPGYISQVHIKPGPFYNHGYNTPGHKTDPILDQTDKYDEQYKQKVDEEEPVYVGTEHQQTNTGDGSEIDNTETVQGPGHGQQENIQINYGQQETIQDPDDEQTETVQGPGHGQQGNIQIPGYGQQETIQDPDYDQTETVQSPGYGQQGNIQIPGYGQQETIQDPDYDQTETVQGPGYVQQGNIQIPGHGQQENIQIPGYGHQETIQDPDYDQTETVQGPGYVQQGNIQIPGHGQQGTIQIPSHGHPETLPGPGYGGQETIQTPGHGQSTVQESISPVVHIPKGQSEQSYQTDKPGQVFIDYPIIDEEGPYGSINPGNNGHPTDEQTSQSENVAQQQHKHDSNSNIVFEQNHQDHQNNQNTAHPSWNQKQPPRYEARPQIPLYPQHHTNSYNTGKYRPSRGHESYGNPKGSRPFVYPGSPQIPSPGPQYGVVKPPKIYGGKPPHVNVNQHIDGDGPFYGVIDYSPYDETPARPGAFTCFQRSEGYYADYHSGCKRFYRCAKGHFQAYEYVCPLGTKFNDRINQCDHEDDVHCKTKTHYG